MSDGQKHDGGTAGNGEPTYRALEPVEEQSLRTLLRKKPDNKAVSAISCKRLLATLDAERRDDAA